MANVLFIFKKDGSPKEFSHEKLGEKFAICVDLQTKNGSCTKLREKVANLWRKHHFFIPCVFWVLD